MVKELYAAVDHLEEKLRFEVEPDARNELAEVIINMTLLRREVTGSLNGNKDYACLFKHTLGVWKASEEVWLATESEADFSRYTEATELFYWVAEKYLGRELKKCARCNKENKTHIEVVDADTAIDISSFRSTLGSPPSQSKSE